MLKRLFRYFNPEPAHTGFAEIKPAPVKYDVLKLELRFNADESVCQYEIWVVGYNYDVVGDLPPRGKLVRRAQSFATLLVANRFLEENKDVEILP